MDTAYDHVQEEVSSPGAEAEGSPNANINTELAEAFKAVSSTTWGTAIGGWWTQARKQGESFYGDLQKEASEVSEQATRGFTSLREQVAQRTRGMSLNAEPGPQNTIPGEEAVPSTTRGEQAEPGAKKTEAGTTERPESLPADIVKEAGSLVASLRNTAAARLKDLQAAEDAADEALLKFGSNVRSFLRDAVTITAPSDAEGARGSEVLFETSEPGTGKKIFHSTRMDAQLHAIHTTPKSFTGDPEGEQWKTWQDEFDIDKQTDAIAKDLDKHEELRRAMEKLVPEKVDYKTFWMRYYFLRKAIEAEEQRRKEVLKGAAADNEEEVGWDDDEDDESSTPNTAATTKLKNESTTTLNATEHLKASRRSHEDEKRSVADSDASYDMVSGATSRAASSPKEEKKKDDDSDEDWE